MGVLLLGIGVILFCVGFFVFMWIWGKKKLKKQEEEIKNALVNKAFDTFLKRGEDYSVAGEVDGAILVKKVVRWAYFERNQEKVNALFSIETDKDVFCFQTDGESLTKIANVALSFYPQIAPEGYLERKKKEYEEQIAYGKKVLELLDCNFDFGDFGIVSKENIDFDDIPRISNDKEDEASIDFSLNKAKEWAGKVKNNQNYFVNYFLYVMLLDVNERDSQFWEHYRINSKEFSDEDCQRIFEETYTEDFEQEIAKYLEVGTNKKISDIIKDKFKFFDYQQFIEGISLKISISKDNHLCLSLSDKFNEIFCEAFEEFSEELEGLDSHNF